MVGYDDDDDDDETTMSMDGITSTALGINQYSIDSHGPSSVVAPDCKVTQILPPPSPPFLFKQKAAKLQSSLHVLMEQPMNKHPICVDTTEKAQSFDPVAHFGTVPELAGRAYNRPRVETLESQPVLGVTTTKELRKVHKMKEQAYQELSQRVDRAKKMRSVLDHMQIEKDVMVSRVCMRSRHHYYY